MVSDTHRETGHGLRGETAGAIEAADRVLHAGDFTTAAVLEAFQAAGPPVLAVHGNRDDDDVCDRLPAERTVSVAERRVAMTHRHESGTTGLTMFGRARDAAVVVSGHTHRPHVITAESVTLVNPGSHTHPRDGPPTHAELEAVSRGLQVRVRTQHGTVIEEHVVETDGA